MPWPWVWRRIGRERSESIVMTAPAWYQGSDLAQFNTRLHQPHGRHGVPYRFDDDLSPAQFRRIGIQ